MVHEDLKYYKLLKTASSYLKFASWHLNQREP